MTDRARKERKVVSVVFVDLVGFTAQAESLDPEDVEAILAPYHTRLRAELERHGGTVEKFIGDAVVAVFGAPVVHEDDAERAVRAALTIRDWADEEQLEVRVAVNTGEALVSVDARPEAGEAMVAGDVVNTAARLQAAAPVNGILVGDPTYRATDRAIEYRAAAPIEAKGKAQPVRVWEAVTARSRFGVDVDTEPSTALVGRRRELDQLLAAFARARAERVPQLVTIVGVPGIGKSRLVQELSIVTDAEPNLIRWRQGRSLPYGEGVSFWALAEMVKAEAGMLESDTSDAALAKLRRAVIAVCAPDEVTWVESELRPLVGLGDEPGRARERREDAFVAWRRFLEGLAEDTPLVLVFEDLHWADDGLLDFIDHLVDWATDVPLLVVASARPELLARRADWGGGKPNAATLSLAPLGETETAELVHALLERVVLPADVQASVLARAGGNPLYAEEFARMMVEHDLDAAGGELPLPESVHGVIAARLDALPREEKELLQDAAVVGKVFWLGAIEGGREASRLQPLIRALERKEFVRRERRSSVEGEQQLAFRHVLVRDVAYGQIPRATRAAKHESVAHWLESLGRPEDQAELLAHHYLSAIEYLRVAGGDSTAVGERARFALREAGRRASALLTPAAARRFYAAALDLWPEDDRERPQLVLELGRVRMYGDLEGDDLVEQARDSFLALGDRAKAAEAEILLGEHHWLRADQQRAVSHFESAEELIAGAPLSRTSAFVIGSLGRFLMLRDEYERSIELGHEAIAHATALGDEELRAAALNNVGSSRVSLGDLGGLADLETSVLLARDRSAIEYVRACGNLGSFLVGVGRLDEAFRRQDEGLAASQRIGFAEPIRWLSVERVWQLYVTGHWKDARALVDQVLGDFGDTPFWIEPLAHVYRARLDLAAGDSDAARERVGRIVALARAATEIQIVNPSLAFAAYVQAELGEGDAGELVDELFAAWRTVAFGNLLGDWLVDLWSALRRLGREEELRPALDRHRGIPWRDGVAALLERDFGRAAATFAEIGALPSEAAARLWGAEWLVAQGLRAAADTELQGALSYYRSVGARRYVAEGERLLAAAS